MTPRPTWLWRTDVHVICLYSVFTHLSPADYVTMLKILRRYVRPEGRLVPLFVDELTDDGLGLSTSSNGRCREDRPISRHVRWRPP
jgi:hypothetical protein